MSYDARCIICDNLFKVFKNSRDKDVCSGCLDPPIKEGRAYGEEINWMVEQLERRIPELMQGLVCPGDCSCDCTYETGCKYFLDKTPKSLLEY